jgi:hypothetical protein
MSVGMVSSHMSSRMPSGPRSRIKRWSHSSHGLAKAGIWLARNRPGVAPNNGQLTYLLQYLGRMDVQLIDHSTIITQIVNTQRTLPDTVPDAQDQLGHHIYQSFLWVLAAYELIRTLDQICGKDPSIYGATLNKEIKDFKYTMERIRIPLAKLERKKYRHFDDDPIAYPVLFRFALFAEAFSR